MKRQPQDGTRNFEGLWFGASYIRDLMVYRKQQASVSSELNSLWPSDIVWQHRSGSTLTQVMACCLMAQGHYLSQCWLIIIDQQILCSHAKTNFIDSAQAINSLNEFEKYSCKLTFTSLRVNKLTQNILASPPGPRLNIKTVLSTYGDFHVKDKTAVRTSYL